MQAIDNPMESEFVTEDASAKIRFSVCACERGMGHDEKNRGVRCVHHHERNSRRRTQGTSCSAVKSSKATKIKKRSERNKMKDYEWPL